MYKFFVSVLFMLPLGCFGQVAISGRVLNQADKKPVANASVFLSNSSIGNESGVHGSFTLSNVRSGKYELIVSVIGFETYSQTITVNDSNIALGDIEILPKQLILNEVTVKATPITDVNRQKYLSWFKDEFLGTSNLALDCKIVNPEVLRLHFDEEKNILTASSSDFLIINNPDLGYKIKYLLKHFSLNLSDRNAFRVQFEGSVLFDNMAGTVSKEKRWQKRRLDVYQNSSMHFLRAALNNSMEEEGFTAFPSGLLPDPQRLPDSLINAKIIFFKALKDGINIYQDSLSFWEKKAPLPEMIQNKNVQRLSIDDIIKPTNQTGIYALFAGNNTGGIRITYNKYHQRYNDESTGLKFRKTYILFDNNGVILDPDGLVITGAWSGNRVAELLPLDYEPTSEPINADQPNSPPSPAQSLPGPLKADLLKITNASDSLNKILPQEKIYLQFDKPYYAAGDTIWFKAYLLNSYLAQDNKSGMLHIDISNDSNKVIKQYLLPVQDGITWGNISLDEKQFATGTYTLRAYTNWMRNLGEDDFFYKQFYVSSSNENSLLVNTWFNTSTVKDNKVLAAKLLFRDMNKVPFAVQPLQLQLKSGSKQLDKQKLQTGVDGILDVSFNIPQKTSGLAIVAESIGKGKRAVIPVDLNRDENIDVQFLPEGGNLVAGLPAHIAFKAIGEDGKGVQISGIITNHSRQQVAEFKALHNGMGSFDLAVKTGESYTARVTLPGGAVKDFALPVIKNSGTVLNIKNPGESDYLEVAIGASNDIVQAGNSYFFIGKARGVVCYAAIVDFADSNFVKKKISKRLFPTGIAHFTVMTTKYQPLNERLVFIDRHDNLHIKISPDKPYYTTRDSVALQIKVTDDEGNPVRGDFSLAVTDDTQVKADTLKDENILTRMLLTSDLKGYMEEPGYYLSTKTTKAWQALDNLLLTQGWIGYDWGQVLNPPVISFQPENDFVVKGSVSNVFNKPVKQSHILLFSKSPSILKDTLTDENGKFVFDRLPRVDTPIFVLKAVNKNGKSFNVRINVDEVNPPDFIKPAGPAMTPWYVNSDTTLLSYNKNNALIKQQKNFPVGGHILKEVNIKAKKIVKGSQNLNGPGEADIVLDEKDMEAAGKKTLLQLLEENVKGFREGAFAIGHSFKAINDAFLSAYVTDRKGSLPWYFINGKPVKLIVDGISAIQVITSPTSPTSFIDMRDYLTSHSAEDVKGIEIIHTAGFAASYLSRYDPEGLIINALNYNPPVNISPSDIAFIEITTRGGHGPVIDNTPGMYIYKPLPLSWPKQFYKPKYTGKDTAMPDFDLRSTLDWEPNITTDARGHANLWFYTAGKPSTYTVTIEGTDRNGRLAYKTKKIKIREKKSKSK